VIDTSYVVAREGWIGEPGTLWAPSRLVSFWPLSATNVADSGQEREFAGRLAAPEPPPR